MTSRATITAAVIGMAAACQAISAGVANAAPAPTPPPPPVLGPLQYGPPAYPPGVGIALLPPARSGVAASSDAISPISAYAPPEPGRHGVAGVAASADVLSPTPPPPP